MSEVEKPAETSVEQGAAHTFNGTSVEWAVAEAMIKLGYVARPVVVKAGEHYITRGWAWQKVVSDG